MSAIFGIIDFEGRPLKEEWIQSMQRDLAHRGPDGQGLYREPSVALGHMLLQVTPESIYDKSPYEEDGLVITANARLDEREAIMDRLDIPKEERDKITDPLLLLRSFKKFGKDFVKDIYGDFAFAIWDKNKRELFCARDQMGVKPFLYYFQDKIFVFSSELKSISRLPFIKAEPDYVMLYERILSIWENPERTTRKNIFRLRQAYLLILQKAELILIQYWWPKYIINKEFKNEDDSAHALWNVLERVLSDHIRGVEKIGVPLSGGLDSTTIVSLICCKSLRSPNRIYAVSSLFDPKEFAVPDRDETQYIKEIIKHFPTINYSFIYSSELNFLNNLETKFNNHYTTVNTFNYVDEAIFNKFHQNSVRRVLSGFLGDITISNSSINPFLYLLFKFKIKSLYTLIKQYKKQYSQSYLQVIKAKILINILPKPIIKLLYLIKGNEKKDDFQLNEVLILSGNRHKKRLCKRIDKSFHEPTSLDRKISHKIWPIDFNTFEEDWDCESSHYQLEISYPFADRRVIELLLQIPVEHFYAKGFQRGLIRLAMLGILPEKIRLRKTKGDYSPGHSQIVQNELRNIISKLESCVNTELNTLIDIKRLKFLILDMANNQNNDNFAFKSMTIIRFAILLLFEKWNRINLNKNEKSNEKGLEPANYLS